MAPKLNAHELLQKWDDFGRWVNANVRGKLGSRFDRQLEIYYQEFLRASQALGPKSIAVNDIEFGPMQHAFEISRSQDNQNFFDLAPSEFLQAPHYLDEALGDIAIATKNSPSKEAQMRTRIDLILLSCLAQDKKAKEKQRHRLASLGNPEQKPEGVETLAFQYEKTMKMQISYKGQETLLNGRADYSLWYGNPEELALNLVVVEAKDSSSFNPVPKQALTYMAMLHRSRQLKSKDSSTIYGVYTDSVVWTFLCLNDDSKWSEKTIKWDSLTNKRLIVSYLGRIMRDAGNTSANSARNSTAAWGWGPSPPPNPSLNHQGSARTSWASVAANSARSSVYFDPMET